MMLSAMIMRMVSAITFHLIESVIHSKYKTELSPTSYTNIQTTTNMNFHPEEKSQEKKSKKHKKKVILNNKKRRYFIKLFLGGNYTFKGCMMVDPIYVFSIIRWVGYNT
jgi:hypothetical protein